MSGLSRDTRDASSTHQKRSLLHGNGKRVEFDLPNEVPRVPKWRQPFTHPRTFVTLLAILVLCHSVLYTYFSAILARDESRHRIHMGGMVCNIYYGAVATAALLAGLMSCDKYGHVLITVSGLFNVCAGILISLSYHYRTQELIKLSDITQDINNTRLKNSVLCDKDYNFTDISCLSQRHTPGGVASSLLSVSSLVLGVAAAPLVTIGLVRTFRCVEVRQKPVFLGIVCSMGSLGAVVAFLLSALFTGVYLDMSGSRVPGDQSNWTATWFPAGMVVAGVSLVVTVLISLVPGRLQPVNLAIKGTEETESTKCITKELLSTLRMLFGDRAFVLLLFASCTQLLGLCGLVTSLPKYLQMSFGQDGLVSNIVTTIGAGIAFSLGLLFGGFLASRIHTVTGICKLFITVSCISAIGTATAVAMRCSVPPLEGNSSNGFISNGSCANNCNCKQHFNPVCSTDAMLFSPCHAGCHVVTDTFYVTNYTQCSCSATSWVSPQQCFQHCSLLLPYLCVIFTLLFTAALAIIPTLNIVISMMPDAHRSLATGIFTSANCIFGFILGPVLFRYALDSVCLVWNETCGSTRMCRWHDVTKYRWISHGFSGSVQGLTVLLYVALWWTLREPKHPERRHDERQLVELGSEPMHRDAKQKQKLIHGEGK